MGIERRSLGEKLRKLRESYNLSQNQVAQALNIDRSTYTNYELDKTRPSLETLVKLAHIYHVPKDHLLPDDDGAVRLRDVSRADAMMQSLSKEERGLIACYRSLDGEGRQKLHDIIAKIAKNQI